MADVKAEVNRSIELEELKKMKTDFEDAARNVEQEVTQATSAFENQWRDAAGSLTDSSGSSGNALGNTVAEALAPPPPVYRHPKKNWRLKRGAMPQWYKQRNGIRAKAQSGAARVARFRPPRSSA